jgi:pyruvate/2-oxoglutarate dehydrogenase complex dihydrolipoamide acyltransferase (E2) component
LQKTSKNVIILQKLRGVIMFGRRSDGKKLKTIDPFYKIIPHIMNARHDSQNLFLYPARCENIDKFIGEMREQGTSFKYMHVVIAAVVRLLALRPALNRFVMNGRIYKRNTISISFAVKKALSDDAIETTIKLDFTGKESIYEIKEAVDKAIIANSGRTAVNDTDKTAKALTNMPNWLIKLGVGFLKRLDKHGMLPKSLIKVSPFHTSCFVTNLKSIKTDYIYHHLYDFGTTGLFISMGKEQLEPVVDENGDITVGKIMKMGIVTDERICDGFYYASSFRKFKDIMENPYDLLEQLPEIEKDID